jgi:hypothetical protein
LKDIFGVLPGADENCLDLKWRKMTGGYRKLHNDGGRALFLTAVNSRRRGWEGYLACLEEKRKETAWKRLA